MRILVTGGAGFIGSHYVRRLLAGGGGPGPDANVTVVDRLGYASTTTSLPTHDRRLTLVHGDVCDRKLMLDVLPGHDAVVHFAAESHVDRSLVDGTEFMRSNVLGTQTLLECALYAGTPRVVHVSTDEVYGSIASGSWTEAEPLLPNSPYAASKAASDLVALAYWRTHRVPVSVTRCCNNYGPYQFPEKVIPRFVTTLLNGGDVPLYGAGRNVREWLHVDDHCRGLDLVLRNGRPGEIYNLGSGVELTNRELTAKLLELCGASWDRVRHVPDRKGHDLRYSVDTGKAVRELGFEPRMPFDESLRDLVAWYRDHRSWWEPLLDRTGIDTPGA